MKKILRAVAAFALASACSGEKTAAPMPPAEPAAVTTVATPAPLEPAKATSGRALLITESLFKTDDKGQYTVPEKGALLVLTPGPDTWAVETIEEPESNVLHKALPYGKDGILTIAGNAARLKLWNKKDGKWSAQTLWSPEFGGKQNRLRDFELADFDGDGTQDLAIATHDQGVVAVVFHRGGKWEVKELDRKPETFVHEIEIGDLDGNGRPEFFATPSEPNTASGLGQGGKILRYAFDGAKVDKSEVVALGKRHIKEVLVADLEKDGKQELYAAIEAEMGPNGAIVAPVEIRRYDFVDGTFKESVVTSLDDRFCRFLVAGDLDGDGQNELVASAFSSGVWLIEKTAAGYEKKLIDGKSGGFEHAAYLTDIEGDGKQELYVADDNGGVIKRYDAAGGSFQEKVIYRRLVPGQAMVWNITDAAL